MKALHNMLDSVRPHFQEGGKLKRFWVVFDALETFAFTPGHVTHNGVHVRDGIDLKRTMFLVIVALLPALLFGTWNQGYQYHLSIGQADATLVENLMVGLWKVIPLIIVSYGVGLGIEFLFAGMRGHAINEGFLVSGMLIPLVMPVDVPLWMVAIAVAFAVVIAKEVFGGDLDPQHRSHQGCRDGGRRVHRGDGARAFGKHSGQTDDRPGGDRHHGHVQ
jgi:Na+-transporting NADH:ubiquinone oxidoreductase subunit B